MSTVVAQPYSTAGNGGRKLVRLSNGWEVAVTKRTGRFDFYVDKKDGNGWRELTYIAAGAIGGNDISIQAKGTDIHTIYGYGANQVMHQRINVLTVANTNIYNVGRTSLTSDSSTAMGNNSLAINPQGTEIHTAWASKSGQYIESFNIRYAKGTINADGSVTWGAVEQLTALNTTSIQGLVTPSIVLSNNSPVILASLVKISTSDLHAICCLLKVNGNWRTFNSGSYVYSDSNYTQSSPSAVVDKDGVIADVWHGKDSTHTTTDYIRFSKSTDGGVTWSPMQKLVPGTNGTLTVDKTNKYVITYEDAGVIKRIESIDRGGTWSTPVSVGTGTNPSSLYDPTFAGQFGSAPSTIYQTASSVEHIGSYTTNSVPTINVTSPADNKSLYENDTVDITGTVSDADVGNSVTVRYQLNAEPARAIKAFISTGATEAFSKSLTFKAGKLFDGETAVTGVLADGVAHKLTVYATDDQGGTSPVVERTFYAVPNRAPALTVDAVTPSGIINTDAFDISGSYSDQDGNTTTVKYKINGSNPVQIAQGTSGAWSFTLPLGKLVVGENTIVIEAEDTYGAKTSKTVKLRKNEVKTSVKTGVARYKIEPPTGTAQEVMLWIQHDANLTLDTAISMTQAAEAETFVPMTLTNTATLSNGQVESEFYYNASAAKENIIVQITQTKSAVDANEKITLISGVL